MSLSPFTVVPKFSGKLIFLILFFMVVGANAELQWYFAFGYNCYG
jgi:hypothetical protein